MSEKLAEVPYENKTDIMVLEGFQQTQHANRCCWGYRGCFLAAGTLS